MHTQVNGQAEANTMAQRLIQRYPKIERLVAEFSQLTESLPEPFTIKLVSAASIIPPSQAMSCDEVEAEHDALGALEFLRMQSPIDLVAKNLDDRNIWSESKSGEPLTTDCAYYWRRKKLVWLYGKQTGSGGGQLLEF